MKTRLSEELGAERTLELYHAFLSDSLLAARRTGAEVLLAHTASRPFPQQGLADRVFLQRGESFGTRWDGALEDARELVGPETPLVLIGADAPHVPPSLMARALRTLERSPAVLGPCVDGGFYLLGFSSALVPLASVFPDPAAVARRATRRITESLGAPDVIETCFDVDTSDDLQVLIDHLRGLRETGAEWIPPATAALLLDMSEAGVRRVG